MKKKGYKSLLFNKVEWKASMLGEDIILLQSAKNSSIDSIHSSVALIEETLSDKLLDIVPAYDSIAIFTKLSLEKIMAKLQAITAEKTVQSNHSSILTIPICYELGLDMEQISDHTGLSEASIIETHLSSTYRSLFIGFTPGFIYADGLDSALTCPRKKNPRTEIEAGSIGIGGEQTGIYSLNSPGGWNIIGRTPLKLFDAQKDPPMAIEVGTVFRFERITKAVFDSWES